jgi:hypothetical protein
MTAKNKKSSTFKKASTPEMVKKQRAAIIKYYTEKRKLETQKKVKTRKSK